MFLTFLNLRLGSGFHPFATAPLRQGPESKRLCAHDSNDQICYQGISKVFEFFFSSRKKNEKFLCFVFDRVHKSVEFAGSVTETWARRKLSDVCFKIRMSPDYQ